MVVTAARKPTILKESSVAEHRMSPETTGMRVKVKVHEVLSPSMSHAKATVKKGAEALTVSTKDTSGERGVRRCTHDRNLFRMVGVGVCSWM